MTRRTVQFGTTMSNRFIPQGLEGCGLRPDGGVWCCGRIIRYSIFRTDDVLKAANRTECGKIETAPSGSTHRVGYFTFTWEFVTKLEKRAGIREVLLAVYCSTVQVRYGRRPTPTNCCIVPVKPDTSCMI